MSDKEEDFRNMYIYKRYWKSLYLSLEDAVEDRTNPFEERLMYRLFMYMMSEMIDHVALQIRQEKQEEAK